MLYRKIETKIEEHIKSDSKKILLIDGARQVGKTYIIRYVGKKIFKNFIEINMVEDSIGDRLFANTKTIEDFYLQVSMIAGNKMKAKSDTLIFIDEIQAYPHLLTLLKFLSQDNKFTYIASGSLLGVTLSQTTSIPIGSIRKVRMYPLDFEEFATANGIQPQTIEYLKKCYDNKETITEAVHQSMLKLFQYYIIVGGMPAVVQKFVDTKDIGEVLKIQKDILDLYRQDISKYSDNNKEKIKSIFDLIPAQLNDRNRRFTLSDIKNSARMLRYETSFNWLADAGVALHCYNITEPVLPLELNLQNNLFKLFLCDTGLLCAASMGNIQFDILSGDLSVNMGSILENVFAQELVSNGFLLRYFNKKNIGEIDFIVQKGKSAVPIEIKSGNDYTKHKALDNLIAKQSWNINSGIVFCKGNLEIENGITYYPWYMSMFFKQETLPEHLKVNVNIVNI